MQDRPGRQDVHDAGETPAPQLIHPANPAGEADLFIRAPSKAWLNLLTVRS